MKAMIEIDIPSGRSIAEAEGAVKRAFDPNWVSEWWHIDDVDSHAESMGIKLTEEECRDVLNLMMHKHDCNIGINWEVIAYWIDQVVDDRPKHYCCICDEEFDRDDLEVVDDRPKHYCCICDEEFDRDDLELVDDGSGDLICVECMHPEGEGHDQGA